MFPEADRVALELTIYTPSRLLLNPEERRLLPTGYCAHANLSFITDSDHVMGYAYFHVSPGIL